MSPRLVRDEELLWVLDVAEPALTREVAAELPLDQNSVYVRLRSLARRGYVDGELQTAQETQPYLWRLTDRGRDRVAQAGLPPATETDFAAHFAGRTAQIDETAVLDALAVHGTEGWVPSTTLYEALPYSKAGIRKKLHDLRESGLVELDDERGQTHYWRLTDAGRARLDDEDRLES